MRIQDLVREDIKNLIPYEPHPYGNVIKLDANENPHPFPMDIISQVFSRLEGDLFTRYPDPLGDELREKLAAVSGVRAENVILGNGSDELIQLILQTFGGPGRKCVIPVPTFSMYKIHSQITGTECLEVPRDADLRLQPGEMLSAVADSSAYITFIATPNNPTGNTVPYEVIENLAQNATGLIIVDEAYIDFGGNTCSPLIDKYPNVVIMRTFSKIGLAGLRIGYLLADVQVVRELLKVKQPYNVNAFSQMAARITLDKWPLFIKQINMIVAERQRMEKELTGLKGIQVYPSEANFILFKVPDKADEIHQQLLEAGVLIRGKMGNGLKDCLRVTIGTRQENEIFLEKLKHILNVLDSYRKARDAR